MTERPVESEHRSFVKSSPGDGYMTVSPDLTAAYAHLAPATLPAPGTRVTPSRHRDAYVGHPERGSHDRRRTDERGVVRRR